MKGNERSCGMAEMSTGMIITTCSYPSYTKLNFILYTSHATLFNTNKDFLVKLSNQASN